MSVLTVFVSCGRREACVVSADVMTNGDSVVMCRK